jgi:hypothetical protein
MRYLFQAGTKDHYSRVTLTYVVLGFAFFVASLVAMFAM